MKKRLVAAAIAANSVTTRSSASIADGVTLVSTGVVKVSAQANTDSKAKSDGEAKKTDTEKGGAPSFSIGVAVSVNDVDVTNGASVGNGSVTGTEVTIEAVMKDVSGDTKHKYEAEATSGASDGDVSIAGGFAGNFGDSMTSAVAKGTINANNAGGAGLKVTATNDVDSHTASSAPTAVIVHAIIPENTSPPTTSKANSPCCMPSAIAKAATPPANHA